MSGSEFPPLEKGKIRLYSNRFCPYAHRTRIILAHKNIEHETVNVNLQSKPEWYLKNINPLGLVPALHCDDKIVYDSTICNEYIDEVYPGEKLIASDPYLRARDRMLTERLTKITEPYVKGLRKVDWSECVTDFKTGVTTFEVELEKRNSPFFRGEKPMNIDFCIWPHFGPVEAIKQVTPEFSIKPEEFPRIHKWIQLMKDVPAVKETTMSSDVYLGMWQLRKEGTIDYDFGLEN